MSEKKLKIIAVVLMVAALICLVIGTAFAVDFMAEHPEEFACDLKRPVVAANRPLVDPVVEPLTEFVSSDSLLVDLPLIGSIVEGPVYSIEGIYSCVLSWHENPPIYDVSFSIANEYDSPFAVFLGFSGLGVALVNLESPYTVFQLLYSDITFYSITYQFDSASNLAILSLLDTNEVESVFSWEPSSGYVPNFFFRSIAPFFVDGNHAPLRYYTFDSSSVVSPIISTLVSGLRSLGANVGRAFSTIANAIFINADGTGLSTFGILIVVFSAVSLGLSLTRWVLNFCGSWGKRNR